MTRFVALLLFSLGSCCGFRGLLTECMLHKVVSELALKCAAGLDAGV